VAWTFTEGRFCVGKKLVILVSQGEEEGVDDAKVYWSSCVRRHAEEQKFVLLVWRSQDKQKSPRRKSMSSVVRRQQGRLRRLGGMGASWQFKYALLWMLQGHRLT
jgi:hypothetical protein